MALVAIFGVSPVLSQWSSNTSVNLKVSDVTGEQILPKIGNTSDGGCYISWFDNRSGDYGVYIQKLGADGSVLFTADGLLVSSNTQNSSLVDYDMTVDDSNNAVIVFTDIRAGGAINPYAYKISPSGQFLWGTNGVALTDSTDIFQPNPKVIQASDGNYIIAWIYGTSPQKIAMQKLSRGGIKQWGSAPIKFNGGPGETFTYPALVPSDNGSAIMMWSGYTGSFINPSNYRLYTQKFSSAGSPLWAVPQDTVYRLGNVSGFYVPRIFTDGNNGALYVWEDDRNSVNLKSSYVQHFDMSGNPKFPLNGSEGSSENGKNKFAPTAAYMPSTQEAFLFWDETNSNQSMQGLSGQKFSSNGTQQWGNNGKVFLPLGSNAVIGISANTIDTNVIVWYNEGIFGSSNNLIKAFRIGKSGGFAWSGDIITPGSSVSSKSRLTAVLDGNGFSKLAWSDGRTDGGGIYAQNISLAGNFGGPTNIQNLNSTPRGFNLSQNYPNPFNPTTSIKFKVESSKNIRLTVFDITGKQVALLVNGKLNPGEYRYMFDGSGFSSGVFFYELKADGIVVDTKKMLMLK